MVAFKVFVKIMLSRSNGGSNQPIMGIILHHTTWAICKSMAKVLLRITLGQKNGIGYLVLKVLKKVAMTIETSIKNATNSPLEKSAQYDN